MASPETCWGPSSGGYGLTVSCFSKIEIRFTCVVPAHLGSPRKTAVKRVCVYITVRSLSNQVYEKT